MSATVQRPAEGAPSPHDTAGSTPHDEPPRGAPGRPGAGRPGAGRPGAGGTVLLLLGLLAALALTAGTALSVVGLLVRQESVERARFTGVEAVGVDARCAGDVSVVADPTLAAGTAEVAWQERWSVTRPVREAEVVDGRLELATGCSTIGLRSSSSSDLVLRLADGSRVLVDVEVGDVLVDGVAGGVAVTSGAGDVDVRRAGGAVDVRSGMGDVGVAGRVSSGRLSTGLGDVRLRSSTVPDEVVVEAGVGDVLVDLPGTGTYDVSVEAGGGEGRVDVRDEPGSPHRVSVTAGTGDVTVRPAP